MKKKPGIKVGDKVRFHYTVGPVIATVIEDMGGIGLIHTPDDDVRYATEKCLKTGASCWRHRTASSGVCIRGRQLLRVRFSLEDPFITETEMPAEDVELVRDETPAGKS